MNLDMMQYERKVFTFFDMLSDIGGLNGILVTVLAIVSTTWNFNSFDNYMVSRLFKINKPEDDIDSDDEYFNQSNYIKQGSFPYFKECLVSCTPKCCKRSRCCKKSRHLVAMEMAREKLDKEINIIEIVKSWRFFENAFKFLLPEAKRLDLKERSRYIAIQPDVINVKVKKRR